MQSFEYGVTASYFDKQCCPDCSFFIFSKTKNKIQFNWICFLFMNMHYLKHLFKNFFKDPTTRLG